MTNDWLEPATLWPQLRRKRVSARKQRLFVCACCRGAWKLLRKPASREAVEVAEWFADGLATRDELARAAYRAEAAVPGFGADPVRDELYIEELIQKAGWVEDEQAISHEDVAVARTQKALEEEAAKLAEWAAAPSLHELDPAEFGKLLRGEYVAEIFGNVLRTVVFAGRWQTSTAVGLARTMYESRDFAAMPILADALEEAGCDSPDVLAHCRADTPHVRGCWVVDLVLGNS